MDDRSSAPLTGETSQGTKPQVFPKEFDFQAFSGDSGRKSEKPFPAAKVTRRRLVGPVFLILFVSFASIMGFLWLSSRGLNEDAIAQERQLLTGLLDAEADLLELAVGWHAADEKLYRNFKGGRQGSGGKNFLKSIVNAVPKIDHVAVYMPTGELILGLKDRKEHQNAESFPFDADVSDLVRKLSSRSVSSASSYVAFENRLALAVAHSINPWGDSPQEGKEPFLVLLSELDADFFNEDALALGIGEVSASLEPVAGRPAIELFGLDRFVAGYVTWHPNSPGDVLLWPLSPAFALGLIAIGYFLFLFVRGADLFVERQAYLASALQQEQNLRDMKMRFVSMISHELRTPLATIRSATELLERYGNRMSSKDQAEELHAIHRSVDVLVRLVDNVVLVGKSDWLGKPGKTVPIDLVEFCYEVWNDLGPVTSSHHLLISEEGERRSLRLDSAYLRALMSNILQNAVKYSPGRDEIMVQLSYKTKTVAIRVTDWGIGISQEDIEEVFEPFKRGRNAESISGSGLGLTIAKASAEAMGGTLAVSSRLGGGTTFEVTFPFSRKEIKV